MRRGRISFSYTRTEHEASSTPGGTGGLGAKKFTRDLSASLTGQLEIEMPSCQDYLTPTIFDQGADGGPVKADSRERFYVAFSADPPTALDPHMASCSLTASYKEVKEAAECVLPSSGPQVPHWVRTRSTTEGQAKGADGAPGGSMGFAASDVDGEPLRFSIGVGCSATSTEVTEGDEPEPPISTTCHVSCDFAGNDKSWTATITRSETGLTLSAGRRTPTANDADDDSWTEEQLKVELETGKPLKIRIVDDLSGELLSDTGKTCQKVVGQKISLRVEADGACQDTSLWKIAWALEGLVKSYSCDIHLAVVSKLTAEDMAKPTVAFYWTHRNPFWQDKKIGFVHVGCEIDGEPFSAEAYFDVLCPDVANFEKKVDAPTLDLRIGEDLSGYYTHAKLTADVTVPVGGAGSLAWFQLVSEECQLGLDGRPLVPERGIKTNGMVLDVMRVSPSVPYPDSLKLAAPGSPVTVLLQDNPLVPLMTILPTQDPVSVNVFYQFQSCLMYRPDGDDSIWVCLGSSTWSFYGYVVWKKASGLMRWDWNRDARAPEDRSAVLDEAVDLPVWLGHVPIEGDEAIIDWGPPYQVAPG